MVIPCVTHREQVLKLIEEKDKIEKKINDLGQVLIANNHVGMNEPLVDGDGFPRNDIDVYQVRTARSQIICLQNDLKTLMKEIEHGLSDVHADARINYDASTKISRMELDPSEAQTSSSAVRVNSSSIAFAKVNFVSERSPAEDAGIRQDDFVLEFGSLNAENFKELTQIADIVKHRQNQQIQLKVRRDDRTHELTLVPKTWSGRGLLGCNIVVLEPNER